MSRFTLPAMSQIEGSHLFRLPYELQRIIYQHVLTATHVHVERKMEYELTSEGIKITKLKPHDQSTTTSQTVDTKLDQIPNEGTSSRYGTNQERKLENRSDEDSSNDLTGNDMESADDDWRNSPSEEYDNGEELPYGWNFSKLYPDSNSTEFLEVCDNTDFTPRNVRNKLFSVYYCRSKRVGGPSAVPPGYLDHEACTYDQDQTLFEGSTIAGFRATCQRAYIETLDFAVSKDPHGGLLPSSSSRGQTGSELASQILHFSNLQDLLCFTNLISEEVAESIHSLSVHVPSLNNDYWTYFCNVFLQPWSRISLSDWISDPIDKSARITFYHNHTTHDLADPTIAGHDARDGDPTGRCEIAEALASNWVVPNIQVRQIGPRGCDWSTKFRMAALKLRAGSPMDLRLSFPIFLRKEERYSHHCLDGMGSRHDEPQSGEDAPTPTAEEEDSRQDWFDDRSWISGILSDAPIVQEERCKVIFPSGCDQLGIHNQQGNLIPNYQWPTGADSMSVMESHLVSSTSEMKEMIKIRMWLQANQDANHHDVYTSALAEYERLFHDTFLKKRRDVQGRVKLLSHVHTAMTAMDECQGLEKLEIDFYGDGHSPGVAKEFNSVGTSILRDGLVERFTGRAWCPRGSLNDPVSVFWDTGPHPEPNFYGWADPNNNMDGFNLDPAWPQ